MGAVLVLRAEHDRALHASPALDRKRHAAEESLKTATEQLEALKSQAREKYGTDDLAALLDALPDGTKVEIAKDEEKKEGNATEENKPVEK